MKKFKLFQKILTLLVTFTLSVEMGCSILGLTILDNHGSINVTLIKIEKHYDIHKK